jgi:hypothetical protein
MQLRQVLLREVQQPACALLLGSIQVQHRQVVVLQLLCATWQQQD